LGKGESDPVAGNDSAAGRQQNRRVEVIISNPPAALR
jgi:flagellar motor protein MotB